MEEDPTSGGLNENDYHSLLYLDAWSTVGESVWV